MPTRRDALQLGAWAVAGAAARHLRAANVQPQTLLILGGTGFLGPPLTEEALRRGWKVTHFNRGKHAAGGVAGVETLIGDRRGELDSLRGRKWDAMVDDTGFVPKFVKMSAELLAPNVGHCLFVSSTSVYANFTKPNDEHSPTGALKDPNGETVNGETYGPMKALCEQYTAEAFKGRISIVRPGYIVGPLDPSDRFTYWPVRASRGGEMLAPGTPRDPIQFIDVRDLAVWMMKLVGMRARGVFNATSPPGAFTMGDLLSARERATPNSGTTVTWVAEAFLAAHLKPEELDLPPWAPTTGDMAGASLTPTKNAEQTGLSCRPVADTVRDTLTWFHSLPAERQEKLRVLIDPQKEADTLHAWHETNTKGWAHHSTNPTGVLCIAANSCTLREVPRSAAVPLTAS